MEIRNFYNDNTGTYETSFYDKDALLRVKNETKDELFKLVKMIIDNQKFKKEKYLKLFELVKFILDYGNLKNENYNKYVNEIYKIEKENNDNDENINMLMSGFYLYHEEEFIKGINIVIEYNKNHSSLGRYEKLLNLFYDTLILWVEFDKNKYFESEEMNSIILNFKDEFLVWINKELDKKDITESRKNTINSILEKYYK